MSLASSLDRPALLVRLQPVTPWRCGESGPDQPASIVASDSLFAALSSAMARLGWADEWRQDRVRLASLLPAHNDVHFVPIPMESREEYRGLKRLRLGAARFAPVQAVAQLGSKSFDESRWILDLASGSLLPADRAGAGGPFRVLERRRSGVDRFDGTAVETRSALGYDFGGSGGLWTLAAADDETAIGRLKAAFRLLADDGIGGWRAAGWGRSRRPRFREGMLSHLLQQVQWPVTEETGHWCALGLLVPGEDSVIDWQAGAYSTIRRMSATQIYLREGSILASAAEPAGRYAPGGGKLGLRFGGGLTLPWSAPQ
ncbi:MAG: hypothetical protein FJW30_16945 [Acidobacteria bacterium]|nr:hypothetical protein [Acidobacteriota bacterium]